MKDLNINSTYKKLINKQAGWAKKSRPSMIKYLELGLYSSMVKIEAYFRECLLEYHMGSFKPNGGGR